MVGLKTHMQKIHAPEDEKKYKCEICDKKFLKNHMLTLHTRMKHTKLQDMKFECYHCQKRYFFKHFFHFIFLFYLFTDL